MERRPTYRAGTFYPGTEREVGHAFQLLSSEARTVSSATGRALGGMVPHAGWMFSGAVAFRLFRRLADAGRPQRLILLGAVHVPAVSRPALGTWDRWEIPGGDVGVDRDLEREVVARGLAEPNRRAHVGEHSIEVQLPLVARLFPDVPVLPIAVPCSDRALELGRGVGDLLRGRNEVDPTYVVASSDLTHYGADYYGFAPAGSGPGAVSWAWANDERFLSRVRALDGPGALREARESHSACGAGAVAAAIECVRRLGAIRTEVTEHTTSLAAKGEEDAHNFVGYASAVFLS